MAGILTFQNYIGGPDSVQVEQIFPSNQKSLVYTFKNDDGTALDLSGWTFTADYQTIVVDSIQFSRSTGAPNFANSTVKGTFPKVDLVGANAPSIINAALGQVKVTFPAGMYSGPIIPDARQNVPITVFALTWTDNSTPVQINTHRWALIQCWEPDVSPNDPTLDEDYTALSIGA
jgi:hypothetical protein